MLEIPPLCLAKLPEAGLFSEEYWIAMGAGCPDPSSCYLLGYYGASPHNSAADSSVFRWIYASLVIIRSVMAGKIMGQSIDESPLGISNRVLSCSLTVFLCLFTVDLQKS